MRYLLTLMLLLAASIAGADPLPPTAIPPAASAEASSAKLLDQLALHSRSSARIEGGRLTGPGAELLRALGRASHFVVIGEVHGNRGIAEFAEAYWRDLNASGFDYAVIETDPWVTAALERELRAGGFEAWTQFMSASGGTIAAPFFSWAPEARWAETMIHTSRARRAPVLWGVDQVFIGSAHWLITDFVARTRNAKAKAEAEALLASTEAGPMFMAQIDGKSIERVLAALGQHRDAADRELFEAMIQSKRIYAPFTGGGGEIYLANTERENLMRRLFLAHHTRGEKADGRAPRVLFKLGASHAQRGASPLTEVQGLGGFVSEFAAARGENALTLLVLCGPGAHTANLMGAPQLCTDSEYSKGWAPLWPHLVPEALTVFDLRSWRMRSRRWAHLDAPVQRMIASFDLLVVVAATEGSALLPLLSPPVFPKQ